MPVNIHESNQPRINRSPLMAARHFLPFFPRLDSTIENYYDRASIVSLCKLIIDFIFFINFLKKFREAIFFIFKYISKINKMFGFYFICNITW